MATELCPQCGTARIGSFRFCRSCQFDFDALPTITPAPAAPALAPAAGPAAAPVVAPKPDAAAAPAPNTMADPKPNTAAALAAVAWLGTAAATGLLAFHQWDASQSLGQSSQGLAANAIGHGLAALLTAYFGARCLRDPSRDFLTASMVWGALNVVLGVYQIANGATDWLFYGVVVASGLAGVLSLAARDAASPAQSEGA